MYVSTMDLYPYAAIAIACIPYLIMPCVDYYRNRHAANFIRLRYAKTSNLANEIELVPLLQPTSDRTTCAVSDDSPTIVPVLLSYYYTGTLLPVRYR